MEQKFEYQYLFLEQEIEFMDYQGDKQSDEEKRVEIIQVFGEEE
jgi:hypothetical protein